MAKPHKNTVYYLLSLLYGGVTEIRNFLFEKKILRSVRFPLPVICVGNLAVGGTGKTPHTEFLLKILNKSLQTAVLSRGYKRNTTGFLLAGSQTNARLIGDEPFQISGKFPQTKVAVDEKRVHGVGELLAQFPETDVIILDDAFQHRSIKAGLNILLTDFRLLFTDDYMLPYGTLRELPKNSKRADIVIITKCPADFVAVDKTCFREKLRLNPSQDLYFSTIEYGKLYSIFGQKNTVTGINKDTTVFLITGIENPEPAYMYIQRFTDKIVPFFYPDHHNFTKKESDEIKKKWTETGGEKLMITTEKDAARLKSNEYAADLIKKNIFALPLEVKILNGEEELFTKKIYQYVRKDSTNSRFYKIKNPDTA